MIHEIDKSSANFISIPELSLSVASHLSLGDISAVACYQFTPTLIEFRYISQFAKERNLLFTAERGEWLADFVNYSIPQPLITPPKHVLVEYISRPEELVYYNGYWIAYGGNRILCFLPPSGWIIPNAAGLLYEQDTGTPFETTPNLEEAEASEYAYFWRAEINAGLRAVNRECERVLTNTFEISMVQEPDFQHDNIGYRNTYRL